MLNQFDSDCIKGRLEQFSNRLFFKAVIVLQYISVMVGLLFGCDVYFEFGGKHPCRETMMAEKWLMFSFNW